MTVVALIGLSLLAIATVGITGLALFSQDVEFKKVVVLNYVITFIGAVIVTTLVTIALEIIGGQP